LARLTAIERIDRSTSHRGDAIGIDQPLGNQVIDTLLDARVEIGDARGVRETRSIEPAAYNWSGVLARREVVDVGGDGGA